MSNEREIYRLERNGLTLLRVSAEAPPWAPRPALEVGWLRWVLASVLRAAA